MMKYDSMHLAWIIFVGASDAEIRLQKDK